MNPAKRYTLTELTLYFLKLGTWGFGGPVALVGYMHRDLVENKQWLNEEEYKEGLALAQWHPVHWLPNWVFILALYTMA